MKEQDDDGAFAALVEQFQAVLGGPGMMGNPKPSTTDEEMNPVAVGEKRSRHRMEEDPPRKRGRGPSEWILVYTADKPKKQRYLSSISDDRLSHHVEKGLSDDLYISSVDSSRNLWALILDAKMGFTEQVYHTSRAFLHKEWIVENWELGFYITALAGNDRGGSLVVMSKGMAYYQQSYKISRIFPFRWVKKKWREGFFVTSIGTSAKQWVVVASRTKMYTDQVVELNTIPSPDRLRRLKDRGLHITAVGATQESAAVIYSVPTEAQAVHQEIVCFSNFPSAHIKMHWSKAMYVSALSCGRTNNFENKPLKMMLNRAVKPEILQT